MHVHTQTYLTLVDHVSTITVGEASNDESLMFCIFSFFQFSCMYVPACHCVSHVVVSDTQRIWCTLTSRVWEQKSKLSVEC